MPFVNGSPSGVTATFATAIVQIINPDGTHNDLLIELNDATSSWLTGTNNVNHGYTDGGWICQSIGDGTNMRVRNNGAVARSFMVRQW